MEGGRTWSIKAGLDIMPCIICRIIGLFIVCRTCSMSGGGAPEEEREGGKEGREEER